MHGSECDSFVAEEHLFGHQSLPTGLPWVEQRSCSSRSIKSGLFLTEACDRCRKTGTVARFRERRGKGTEGTHRGTEARDARTASSKKLLCVSAPPRLCGSSPPPPERQLPP